MADQTTNNKPVFSSAANGICPFCKDPWAYQGLNKWECTNDKCRAFSPKQKELMKQENVAPPMSKEELERKADEDELAREIQQNYGPYIWGFQSTAHSSYSPAPTDKDTDPPPADLIDQLNLLYPNH